MNNQNCELCNISTTRAPTNTCRWCDRTVCLDCLCAGADSTEYCYKCCHRGRPRRDGFYEVALYSASHEYHVAAPDELGECFETLDKLMEEIRSEWGHVAVPEKIDTLRRTLINPFYSNLRLYEIRYPKQSKGATPGEYTIGGYFGVAEY